MHDIYKISNTQYLESEKEYLDPTLYPAFQEDYLKFKDELIRSNIVTIDKLTENIKEDVEENKEAIKDLEDKVYKKR